MPPIGRSNNPKPQPQKSQESQETKPQESQEPQETPQSTPSPKPAPTTRLAVTTAMTSSANSSGKERYPFHVDAPPTVRLASTGSMTTGGSSGPEQRYPFSQDAPPNVRLAHVPGAQGDNVLIGRNGVERMSDTTLPALLVSYYYLEKFEQHQAKYCYRDWVMDSGAFSAHSSGAVIDLQAYIDCCKRLMLSDPTLTEIYALDVIGDWKGTKANTEEMWKQGVPAIPCFHYGEPWGVLKDYCAQYPKVAIGGCVGRRDKVKFLGQCFARQWPHKFHGFGFGSEDSILGYPLHSADATNWELTPCIAKGSLVSTTDGLIPIEKLVGNEFSVNTYNQLVVPNCTAIEKGMKNTVNILLNTGQYLTCTSDHKVLTSEGWKEAGQLEEGDKIRIVDKQLRTPIIKESLVDEMLGWITGDGFYCSTHRFKGEFIPNIVGILFAIGKDGNSYDEEAMDRLMPIWDSFVGKSYPTQVQHKPDVKIVKKSSEDSSVIGKFHALGFRLGRAVERRLPRYIFTAETYRQLSFLKGLFSADGGVKKYPNGMYECITLASNSRVLLDEVQLLLLEFGIQSGVSWYHPPGHKNEQGKLTISGVSALRYMEIIGFNLSRKTSKFGTSDGRERKARKCTYKREIREYATVKEVLDNCIDEVYDIIMPSQHHFIANGLVVHNCGFGRWRAFGGAKISVRGSSQNLRCEVLYYLELEQRARERWTKEMALLEEKFPIPPLYRGPSSAKDHPKGRLALTILGGATSTENLERTINGEPSVEVSSPKPPTIRLAESGMSSYDSERQKGKLRALNPEAAPLPEESSPSSSASSKPTPKRGIKKIKPSSPSVPSKIEPQSPEALDF